MIICSQAIIQIIRPWRLRNRSVELFNFKENEISKQNSLNVISNLSAQCWNVVFCVRVNLLQFIHFHNSILLRELCLLQFSIQEEVAVSNFCNCSNSEILTIDALKAV